MRFLFIVLFLGLLQTPVLAADLPAISPPSPPAEVKQPLSPAARIDQLMGSSIQKGLISGGVVLVGDSRSTRFAKGYGRVTAAAEAKPMTVDTIFDLASLTKVIATAPAILKLAEEGKLSLVDPVKKWFPEFEGKGKDELLLLYLLTHTSALNDFSLDSANPMQSAIQGAASQKLNGELGSRFHYADINFILLAEVVRRASGTPLDEYAVKNFYAPLGMKDTAFRPAADKKGRIAATGGDEPQQYCGEPQDHLCRQLGGVAGHAGLFSTADDLALFCRMILGGGQLDGKRVMAQRTVSQMTAPYFSRGGKVIRGLGWDIASPFSSPRGNFFSRGSFGHTGYSGSSVWIDPDADLYVILLTTRVEYRKKGEFNQMRSTLSTLAVEAFGAPPSLQELEDADSGE
ncbi:MAG: beta-lactamase [Deltaproteobacteria bacterium]|nr:beta-lactamase [Deltaproteobacteria bacterium]